MQAREKFIAFIDILGFSARVEAAEASGASLESILKLVEALGATAESAHYADSGPSICPASSYIDKGLDFVATQVSDCLIMSVEISPAGIVNLVSQCFGATLSVMAEGAQCRGMITRGTVFHTPSQIIGVAYQRAVSGEKSTRVLRIDEEEVGTPFIQLEDSVVDFIRDETDECVRMMIDRVTISDGRYTAVYPFKALMNKPFRTVSRQWPFDPLDWLATVQRSIRFRQADLNAFRDALEAADEPRDKQKISHYIRGLEPVLAQLRRKEARALEIVRTGQIPWGTVL